MEIYIFHQTRTYDWEHLVFPVTTLGMIAVTAFNWCWYQNDDTFDSML